MEALQFDNQCLEQLPVDEEKKNFIRTVEGACYSLVDPAPLENPQLVAVSAEALSLIDLNDKSYWKSDEFLQYFSGDTKIPGSRTAAHCYCGHQFGYFSGQLGDGAAMYVGEVINKSGERWELQFKGSGPTPYSRQADGRKVLRSSIREFLCSEAMFHLGIPTTRAGSIITSDTQVIRDMFYNGNPQLERATIITRIAPSFIRFGSFEITKQEDAQTGRSGSSPGRHDITRKLLTFVIQQYYPDIHEAHNDQTERDLAFFKELTIRTAKMVAMWQAVGWCHGVLNTDNMSILGITIDYGPFGFMERYDPNFICNRSDDSGRYDYVSQPPICKWNLEKLIAVLEEFVPEVEMKKILRDEYDATFKAEYLRLFRQKLGIQFASTTLEENREDRNLIKELLHVMHETAADFTNLFRTLSSIDIDRDGHPLCDISAQLMPLKILADGCKPRIHPMQLQKLLQTPGLSQMMGLNSGMLQREVANFEKFQKLSQMTQQDKTERDIVLWRDWIKKYQDRIRKDIDKGLQQNPDSSREELLDSRVKVMNNANPAFVLRNHVAQEAIEKAEEGDFSKVQELLERLRHPFELFENETLELPPEAAANIAVTCSS